ncbi:MAG: clan AA aspartic protease [Deltaproteobacteria bacterium]|nr:clan AA aspartic protease [Deltaproteobacteria bacterium]
MGIVHAEVVLSNPANPARGPMTVDAIVDTGATHLCISAHVAAQLGIGLVDEREVCMADDTPRMVPYGGPIRLQFGNRGGFFGAMVVGSEVLLGAIVLEDLDLVVHPRSGTLTVNPQSPNVPRAYARAACAAARPRSA